MGNVLAKLNSMENSNEEFSPFHPDTILPVQYYTGQRSDRSQEPMKRLMHAILIDAVRCYQTNVGARHGARRKEFAEARYWLFLDNSIGPFSLLNICDVLELDARSIRRSLKRWHDQRSVAKRGPGEMSA